MRCGIVVLRATVTAVLVGLGIGPALAVGFNEDFEETKPPAEMLQGKLWLGEDGTWTGKVEKGIYFLINRGSPNAIKTVVLPEPVASGAPLTVAVDVLAQPQGQQAGAGLLYGAAPDGKSYHAFVVTPNGGYAVYRADSAGLHRLSEGSNRAIRPGGTNRLAVRLTGSEAVLSINGERVFGHEAAIRGSALTGRVGLIAMDLGAYSFDNFAVSRD